MNLNLSEDLDTFINQEVSSNITYDSPDKWVHEAIRDKIKNDYSYQAKMVALKEDIGIALEQSRNGEAKPLDMEQMLKELDEECLITK
ncbi:MAG: Arc/MetJ-type ribon-helix-helix transcriptional regulator [Alteromonadaceae bacterium]|jgi:Arc/MetJ-type ribon-helix-helix transcriptional regulator